MKTLVLAATAALATAITSAKEVSTLDALYEALEATTPDAEIIVAPGDYHLTKTLSVPVGVTLRSRDGAATTRILQQEDVAQQAFRSAELQGVGAVIDGFTFKDIAYTSAADTGCVIWLANGGAVSNCVIRKCVSYSGYGIVAIHKGSTVSHCQLIDNSSAKGGSHGIACSGSGTGKGGITIDHCLIVGGRPTLPSGGNSYGPGLYFNTGDGIVVSHCTIVDNFSTAGGRSIGNNNRGVTVSDSIVLSSCLEPYATAMGVTTISDSNKKITFKNSLGVGLVDWNDKAVDNIECCDAKFVNPLLGDYHLKADSPCIGKASDGGDIGCFAYDDSYASDVPVVNVAAGADLAAAIASAAEGSEIRLAEGTYTVSAQIDVEKAVKIVGAGRGKTTVKSDGLEHRIFRLNHWRSSLESMTIADAVGTNVYGSAVYLDSAGGLLRDCRVTGCRTIYTKTSSTCTVGVSTDGVIFDTQIDGNSLQTLGTSSLLECTVGAAGVSIVKGTTAYKTSREAHLYRCLIVRNHGTAFYGNNSDAMTPTTQIRFCTMTDNDFGFGLSSGRSLTIADSIIEGGYEFPIRDAALFTVTTATPVNRTLYSGISGGTTNDCVVANNPKFVDPIAGDYHLTAASPARGIATGGADAGCFQYDDTYTPADTTIDVPAGSDLTSVVAAAADGSTLNLAAGTHYVSAPIVLDRPMRIVGADGRDATFVEPTAELSPCTLFTIKNILVDVRELTVRKSTGRAFLISGGGRIERCRVTDSVADASWKETGLGVYCNYGHVYRCQFDNISFNAHLSQSICNIRSNKLLSTSPSLAFGYMDDSLVMNCTGRDGTTVYGSAVYLDRDSIDIGGSLRNCTVFNNSMKYALNTSSYAAQIRNCAIDGTLSVSLSDANKLTRMTDNCLNVEMGTRCVVTNDLCLNSKGRPRPNSPVLNEATPLDMAATELDIAGNPRVREDGTQDIGCWQYLPRIGLSLIIK